MDRVEVAHMRRLCKGLETLMKSYDDAQLVAKQGACLAEDANPIPKETASQRRFGMFGEIHRYHRSVTYSTWFILGKDLNGKDIICGAAHSVEVWPESRSDWPEWAQDYPSHEIHIRPNGWDIVFFGTPHMGLDVVDLEVGDDITIRGYPAGVTVLTSPEVRTGKAYLDRDENGDGIPDSLIIVFKDGEEDAVGGMSGGPVTKLVDGVEKIGAALITRNGAADVDQDGDEEGSSDVVEIIPAIKWITRQVAGRAVA